MLKNYLNVALRNLRKQKAYSFITLSGLIMGLGVFVLFALLVEFILEGAREMGCRRVRAGAQITALDFWERLGFHPTGEEYMDFHVPHEWTEKELWGPPGRPSPPETQI